MYVIVVPIIFVSVLKCCLLDYFVILRSWDWIGDIHRCVIGGSMPRHNQTPPPWWHKFDGEWLDNFRKWVSLRRATTFGDSVWWDILNFGGPALVAVGATINWWPRF